MALFGNKSEKPLETEAKQSNIIGKGTVIKGDIEAYGVIRIDGKVIGNIKSKSKVFLGNGSQVEGNLLAQNAEVEGEVSGDVKITETLTLKPTAVVHGNIFTAKLVVDSGAIFNGRCTMGDNAANLNGNENTANESVKQTGQPQKSQKPIA